MFFLYRKNYHEPVNKIDEENILKKLATTSGLEKLPNLLEQYATTARNQYLYSGNEVLKGTILAFTTFRDQIVKRRPVKKKELTREEKNVIMKKRGY